MLVSLAAIPAEAQTQDCAGIVRDLGEQRRLGDLARTRAQLLREGWYRADALHRGLIFREPSYTPENLTAGIQNTRSDPYFDTDTPRGIMLGIHARTLDALRDILAGNELLGMFGIDRSTAGTVLPIMAQFDAEARAADTEAGRYEWAAASLEGSLNYCLSQLAAGAASAATPAMSAVPASTGGLPAGMTRLCHLTGGPRAGEIINLSEEVDPAHYVPIGDFCYDHRPDTSIGLGVAEQGCGNLLRRVLHMPATARRHSGLRLCCRAARA
jgi:hypothetical protein